jgi:hypothetical protein
MPCIFEPVDECEPSWEQREEKKSWGTDGAARRAWGGEVGCTSEGNGTLFGEGGAALGTGEAMIGEGFKTVIK